jgi:hypothetical protein
MFWLNIKIIKIEIFLEITIFLTYLKNLFINFSSIRKGEKSLKNKILKDFVN